MPWYPDDWIDEVTASCDIVDVIREYVVLKPSGRGYFGLCPFHNEKTASFHVSPEKQLYHCFGCGEGGNVISFIMAMERLDFVEALHFLAEKAGIPIPEQKDTGRQKVSTVSEDIKEELYDINRECAGYYHKMLLSDQGRPALEYLRSRGLNMGVIKAFGLGYAPDDWESALRLLKSKGYDESKILAAGIAVENKEKGRVYDRFRNRIMFPIIDMRGRVTGFGGRVMDDSLPKYLNTSDSPVFNKSTTLYGINRTKKVRPLEFLIIVEGYMDVIALHRFGFPQAVASLGTSLTMEQAKLMRRLASEVYIAYDGDTAGQAATLRGLDILKEAGCKVRVMQFPQGMDPDEVLARYGPEYFKKLMAQSFPLIGYKFEMLKSKYDLSTQSGGMDACKEGCEILAKVDNEIEREVYIPQLEAITGIRQEAIRAQIKKIRSANEQNNLKRNISGNNRNTRDKKSLKILHSSQTKAEMYLINLMAQGETAAAKVVEGLEDISPEGSLLNETADIVKGLLERGREVNGAQILSHMQDEAKAKKLIEIFNIEMEYDNIDNFISDCLDMVAVGILESKRQNIQNEITRMDQEGISDPDKYRMLLKQLKDINAEIKFRQTRKEGSS